MRELESFNSGINSDFCRKSMDEERRRERVRKITRESESEKFSVKEREKE